LRAEIENQNAVSVDVGKRSGWHCSIFCRGPACRTPTDGMTIGLAIEIKRR
jgi:hypothetical protein